MLARFSACISNTYRRATTLGAWQAHAVDEGLLPFRVGNAESQKYLQSADPLPHVCALQCNVEHRLGNAKTVK